MLGPQWDKCILVGSVESSSGVHYSLLTQPLGPLRGAYMLKVSARPGGPPGYCCLPCGTISEGLPKAAWQCLSLPGLRCATGEFQPVNTLTGLKNAGLS
jgi:hypothetical protein